MPGSAEVKSALAFARRMRHPATGLLSSLDHVDRIIRAIAASPDILTTDPTRRLADLLSIQDSRRATSQADRTAGRSPELPARSPARQPRPVESGASRRSLAPASLVDAARLGAERVAVDQANSTIAAREQQTPSTRPSRLGRADVAAMRDALRHRDGRAAPALPGGTPTSIRDMLGIDYEDQPSRNDAAQSPIHRRAGEADRLVPARSLASKSFDAPNQRSRSNPSNSDDPTTTGVYAATLTDPAHARLPDLGHATHRGEYDESFKADVAGSQVLSQPAGQLFRSRSDDEPAPHPVRVRPPIAPPVVLGTARYPAGSASASTGRKLDDEATTLAEAAWRAGIDQP